MDWKASCWIYRHGRRCCGGIHFQSARGQGMYHRLIKAQKYFKSWCSELKPNFNQTRFFQDPDPRKMQINLTGFLNGKNARIFMGELWKLLDSAQNNESGIPQEMIDKKKEEIKNRRVWLYIHWGWANVVIDKNVFKSNKTSHERTHLQFL